MWGGCLNVHTAAGQSDAIWSQAAKILYLPRPPPGPSIPEQQAGVWPMATAEARQGAHLDAKLAGEQPPKGVTDVVQEAVQDAGQMPATSHPQALARQVGLPTQTTVILLQVSVQQATASARKRTVCIRKKSPL